MTDPEDFTRLAKAAREGDERAAEQAFEVVYRELRRLAHLRLAQAPYHSIQGTELAHEVYERLVAKNQTDWEDRKHFFALASRAIRDILVERARRAGAQKRGGNVDFVGLTSAIAAAEEHPLELLMLDEALSRLYEEDAESARIVELMYFVGLTGEETAALVGVSPATIDRRWAYARATLRQFLHE